MRLAVIADTHMPKGDRRLPPRCLELLGEADLIIHAGDWIAEAVVEELEAIGPPLIGVHGNVDEPGVVRRLPAETTLEVGGWRIAVTHDAGPSRGRAARLRARFPDADAVIFGHSHMPLLEATDDLVIFNPGSPTERRRAPARSMGIADLGAGKPPRFRHVEL